MKIKKKLEHSSAVVAGQPCGSHGAVADPGADAAAGPRVFIHIYESTDSIELVSVKGGVTTVLYSESLNGRIGMSQRLSIRKVRALAEGRGLNVEAVLSEGQLGAFQD